MLNLYIHIPDRYLIYVQIFQQWMQKRAEEKTTCQQTKAKWLWHLRFLAFIFYFNFFGLVWFCIVCWLWINARISNVMYRWHCIIITKSEAKNNDNKSQHRKITNENKQENQPKRKQNVFAERLTINEMVCCAGIRYVLLNKYDTIMRKMEKKKGAKKVVWYEQLVSHNLRFTFATLFTWPINGHSAGNVIHFR